MLDDALHVQPTVNFLTNSLTTSSGIVPSITIMTHARRRACLDCLRPST